MVLFIIGLVQIHNTELAAEFFLALVVRFLFRQKIA